MRSLMCSLLVWLMVLAVPMQGMAGVAMQHCAQAAARTEQPAMAEVAQHGHAQGRGHAHGSLQAQAPADADPVAAAHVAGHGHGASVAGLDTSGAGVEHAKAASADADHHCSACAACCSVLGLPSWATPLPLPRVAVAAGPLPRVAVDSFVPAGLDRPPRIRLA